MQLAHPRHIDDQSKTKLNITSVLATATCALLGISDAGAAENDWEIDTAILYYGEADRVTAIEGVVSGKRDFGDDHIFSGKVVIDTLTGASASGAVPQPQVQTFTRPSGNGQYQISAGELPLDDTFRDTRLQLEGQWTQPLWSDMRVSSGVHLSKEYDYLSLAINGSLAKDFNQKNTTVSAGLSLALDSIDPEGGRPLPYAEMVVNDERYINYAEFRDAFDATRELGAQDKTVFDLLFGVTQVVGRKIIMQFNYGYSKSDGYHTDPFKVLSVVEQQGYTQKLVHEVRPDGRARHSAFWQTKMATDVGVVDVSYRYSTDDWQVNSQTVDTRFRVNLSAHTYIQPHIRFYQQSAADFYHPFLLEVNSLPTYATADYRLGEMSTYTLGFKYGMTLPSGHEWAFRLEYYQQNPTFSGVTVPEVLNQQDLSPSLRAIIAQFSYGF